MSLLHGAVEAWVRRNAPRDPRQPPAGRAPAIVVTGGSEGIGLALARRFRAGGQTVILVARHADRLAAAAADLSGTPGPRVLWIALDVTEEDAPGLLAAAVAAQGHYIDVLINNAGIGLGGPFAEQDAAVLDRLIALNVAACTALLRHVLPDMLARARGGVMLVASLGGFAPGPYQAAYYASKAYVLALGEAVQAETSGSGVRVCVLTPGPVETEFHRRMGVGVDTALYRRLMPQASVAQVADAAFRGYRLARPVIIPGVLNRLAALAMRIIPHRLVIPTLGWLLWPRT